MADILARAMLVSCLCTLSYHDLRWQLQPLAWVLWEYEHKMRVSFLTVSSCWICWCFNRLVWPRLQLYLILWYKPSQLPGARAYPSYRVIRVCLGIADSEEKPRCKSNLPSATIYTFMYIYICTPWNATFRGWFETDSVRCSEPFTFLNPFVSPFAQWLGNFPRSWVLWSLWTGIVFGLLWRLMGGAVMWPSCLMS